MPVYNRAQYLKESIESILNQTFNDFEFIIVDDQSTDSSWEIIQEYSDKDKRIITIKNTDEKGCWSARNFGWNLANGKYLAIMDSDDIALPKRLQTQFDFMEQNPDIDICGSWIENFGDKIIIGAYPQTHDEIRDNMFFGDSIAQPSVMLKKVAFDKFNLKYKNYIAEDYELWSRAINFLKFYNIQEPLLLYRSHAEQIGTQNKTEQDNCADFIRLRNLEYIGLNLSDKDKKIYLSILHGEFVPKTKSVLITSVTMLNKILIAGAQHDYGQHFQERIRNSIKDIATSGIHKKITSLKLYFTIFRKWKIFKTPKANLRYIYHCLRNLLHL